MKHNLWNLISCLKNGYLAKKAVVHHADTRINKNVLQVLWDEGYISGYRKTNSAQGNIHIYLKYDNLKKPCIQKIRCVSKPGKKIHFSYKNLLKTSIGSTLVVVSTNRGLKTLDQCKKLKIGGEPLLLIS